MMQRRKVPRPQLAISTAVAFLIVLGRAAPDALAENLSGDATGAKAVAKTGTGGDGGIIKNQSSPHAKLHSVDLQSVRWTGGFWAEKFEKTAAITLPRLRELADPWAWHNMQVAAGLKEGEAKGCYWEDAWLYKWIESACYVYTQTRDPNLLRQMDEVIATVAKAQQPDGYLATQVTLRERPRFALNHHHELYTMGHLLTAASIHHRVTGQTDFLDVARRAADYVHKTYDGGDPMLANCPVNPSIIMGAVELYRTTGEQRYLHLANIIINNRGKKRGKIGRTDWGRPLGGTDLNQDRVPLRNAKEVVGDRRRDPNDGASAAVERPGLLQDVRHRRGEPGPQGAFQPQLSPRHAGDS